VVKATIRRTVLAETREEQAASDDIEAQTLWRRAKGRALTVNGHAADGEMLL
jgi:hypothetical protein